MYVITHTRNKRTRVVGTCLTASGANRAKNRLDAMYSNDAFSVNKTSSMTTFFHNKKVERNRKRRDRERYERLLAQYSKIGEMLMEYQED